MTTSLAATLPTSAPDRPPGDAALQLVWQGTDGGARLVEAVLALLGPVAERIEMQGPRGWRPVRDLQALAPVLHHGVDLRLRLGPVARVDLSMRGPVAVHVSPGVIRQLPTARTWLQADPLLRSPLHALAVPLPGESVHPDFLHGLVALAHRCAPLISAAFAPGNGQPDLRWTCEPGAGQPLVSRAGDAAWVVGAPGEASSLRFLAEPEPGPSATLLAELQTLLARAPLDLEALAARLRAELPSGPAIRLALLGAEQALFHVPAPSDACLRLVPEPQLVRIELDPALTTTPEVMGFSVSGLQVVKSWLDYRMKKGAGKKSSPLDDIRPERWTEEMTRELLELLWVLEWTLEQYPTLDAWLDEVLASELFTAA